MTLPEGWTVAEVSTVERAAMLKSAQRPNVSRGKITPLTKAGRELTQHPHILGFGEADGTSLGKLMKGLGGEEGINRAALQWIEKVLVSGTCIKRTDQRKGRVIEFYEAAPQSITAQTNGARFTSAYEFVGFLGRPRAG